MNVCEFVTHLQQYSCYVMLLVILKSVLIVCSLLVQNCPWNVVTILESPRRSQRHSVSECV